MGELAGTSAHNWHLGGTAFWTMRLRRKNLKSMHLALSNLVLISPKMLPNKKL